jgi:phage baseplate assembly protein W
MNCIGFPKIFKGNSTVIKGISKDKGLTSDDASRECISLLLYSEKGELFGDPQFGIRLKRYTYEQNNYILRDILIDEIYEQLNLFCPQINVVRSDIKIIQENSKLYLNLKVTSKLDFTTSTYNLALFNEEE